MGTGVCGGGDERRGTGICGGDVGVGVAVSVTTRNVTLGAAFVGPTLVLLVGFGTGERVLGEVIVLR